VVQQRPDDPQALYNLALALKDAQQLEAALQVLDQLMALAPGHPGLHGNRAIVLFLLGRYSEAWQEYHWRFEETPQILQRPKLNEYQPQMGRVNRLLVLAEQGLGDSLQFVRYLNSITALANKLQLVVQPALMGWVERCFPAVEVMPAPWKPEQLEQVDAWLPLINAAALLEISPQQPGPCQPYLQVDAARVQHWQQQLGPSSQRRIALAWQGNPAAERGHARGRSLPLAAFAPLMGHPDWQVISVQRGAGSEQIDQLGWRDRFHPLQQELDGIWDFEEIGAILHNCDLLISSDTAITHLAGACGLPAVLLLKWTPDWRWGLQGERSFWYPNHRLFRQRDNETWPQTVQRLVDQGC
jgi:hypothetical protein